MSEDAVEELTHRGISVARSVASACPPRVESAVTWHTPSAEEVRMAAQLTIKYLVGTVAQIEADMSDDGGADSMVVEEGWQAPPPSCHS